MRKRSVVATSRRFAVALTFLLAASATVAQAATTYTWNVASGSWGAASNWSPARAVLAADDILVFDGTVTPTASVSSVPNQAFGQLHLRNSVAVTLTSGVAVAGTGTISKAGTTVTGVGTTFLTQVALGDIIYGNTTGSTHEVSAIATNTSMTVLLASTFASQAWSIAPKLMPSVGPGDDFVIESGSTLTIASGLPPISIFLPTGGTASISGALVFLGNVHRLNAADAGAINVQSGGSITSEVGYVGNPFTISGTAGVVHFQSGSTFVFRAGSNPFALTAPASKCVFHTGSVYRHESAGQPSLSGRTYANFVLNVAATIAINGTQTWTMDDLTTLQGTFNVTTNLPIVVKGNVSVAPGSGISHNPTASTPFTLGGTALQTISGGGTLSFAATTNLTVNNPAGVTLLSNVTTPGPLTLTNGRLNTTLGARIHAAGSISSTPSGWVNGPLEVDVAAGPASPLYVLPVGNAAAKATVTTAMTTVGSAGTLIVSTATPEGSLLGSGLAASRSVNRRWTISGAPLPTFASAAMTLEYPAGEVDGGATPANFRVGKFNAPSTWTVLTPSGAGATQTTVIGLTSFSDFVVAEPCPAIAVTPPTLPDGAATVAYSQALGGSGGASPYTFAVTAGTLPSGLALSGAGLLSGTPASPGISGFTVTATDADGCTGTRVYSLTIGPPPDNVAAIPVGGSCISTAHPCVAVPVVWDRTDTTPARGYSVTLQLSANLSLCGAQFASGGYLVAGSGGTSFLVTPLGGNQYTVDEATLGLPCGATGDGTLFTLHVASADAGGSGTITVLSATARDCNNASVPATVGLPATIPIDNVVPAAVTLSALQKKTGNVQPPDGTTDVLVSWTAPEAGTTVSVYRKGFGGYPQYDENGGAVPATSATPAAASGAGWTLTSVTSSGSADRSAARDFYYYVAYVTDGCGNVSAVSNQAGGTLNYHLGDVFGTAACNGNDLVNTADVSFLGAHYGITTAVNDALECLDIGPTTTGSVDGRPTTDNRTDFEDLILLAINYGNVSAPQAKAVPAAAAANTLRLGVPVLPPVGATFAVTLELEGAGNIQGVSAQLGYDGEVVEFLAVEAGELLERQGAPGTVLSSRAGSVDVALLGTGAGLRGRGAIATARFRVKRAGDPAIVLAAVDARDGANQPVALEGAAAPVTTVAPAATSFAPARPTPFRDGTVLEYGLARPGTVELAIYGVDGRRIATLERGERAAGVYRIAWDGRDERGGRAPAGMYYARLSTAQGKFNRTLVRVR